MPRVKHEDLEAYSSTPNDEGEDGEDAEDLLADALPLHCLSLQGLKSMQLERSCASRRIGMASN